MKIGTIIKKIRSEKKISQGDLAKACDISQTYLSQIENDLKKPSFAKLNTIAEQLKIPLSVLFYLSIEESDVPANKRRAYRELSPTIESLINAVYL